VSKKLLICSVAAWVVFGTVTVEAAPLTFDDPLFTGAGLAAYEPDGIGFVFDFDGFGDPTKPN